MKKILLLLLIIPTLALAETLPVSLTETVDGKVVAKHPEVKNVVKIGIDPATKKPIWSILVPRAKAKEITATKNLDRIQMRQKLAKIYIDTGTKDADGNPILKALSYSEWVAQGKPEYVRWIEMHRWVDPAPGTVEMFIVDKGVVVTTSEVSVEKKLIYDIEREGR